jgi:hypothetical protein
MAEMVRLSVSARPSELPAKQREPSAAHMETAMSQMIRLRDAMARPVLIGAMALFLCFGFAHNARAENWVKGDTHFADNDDTLDWSVTIVDQDNPSHYFVVYQWKDGASTVIEAHDGNPGPDDPGPKKGDQQSRIALAKQHGGGNWTGEREFWDSPVGQRLTSQGKGPGPVINPGDDNAGGGPGNPSRGKEKLGEPIFIDKTGGLGAGGEGGFQFNAGSPADQLNKPGGPPGGNQGGGGSDDDDDKGGHKPPPGSNFGPAELVDPLGPPIARLAKKPTGKITLGALGGPDTKTGKRKSGEAFLPYVEQKSLKKSGGITKGSERGVIAIIKPGETTGIGNPELKNKGALGGPDTKGVTQNTFSSLGGNSSLSARISGASMSGVGRVGAGVGSLRVR